MTPCLHRAAFRLLLWWRRAHCQRLQLWCGGNGGHRADLSTPPQDQAPRGRWALTPILARYRVYVSTCLPTEGTGTMSQLDYPRRTPSPPVPKSCARSATWSPTFHASRPRRCTAIGISAGEPPMSRSPQRCRATTSSNGRNTVPLARPHHRRTAESRVVVAGIGRLPARRLLRQRLARQPCPPRRTHDPARVPGTEDRSMDAGVTDAV